MCKKLIIITTLFFASTVFAQENIVDYQEGSLPVLNEELRKLRDDIEESSSHGIPKGGTEGQLLTKDSAVDYDVTWIDIGSLLSGNVSTFNTFGGDGSDGAVTVAGATNFSAIDSAVVGTAQYTSLTIETGNTLTINTGYAFIGVSGTCTITGTISADAQGGAEGAGAGASGTDSIEIVSTARVPFSLGGAGGGGDAGADGGGAGGTGGTGTTGGVGNNGETTPVWKSASATNESGPYIITCIAHSRGGGGGGGSLVNGGAGGGTIYIECDDLVFTGTLTSDGGDGTAAGIQSSGGGGGGTIIIRANTITTNTGTIAAAKGDKGGGNAGLGAVGFTAIIDVS